MSKHTQEPWVVSLEDSTPEWSVITADGGRVVANVNEETGPELIAGVPVMRVMPGEINARRIVACVNACEGIGTEELELCKLSSLNAVHKFLGFKKERDDLLAALELAESAYRLNVVVEGEPSTILDAMQKAIAKAKGGAA